MPEVENHNSGQWLRVEYWDGKPIYYRHDGPRQGNSTPGWFVIRTCPCHAGLRVSRRYENVERADRARHALIEVSMRLGT